MTSRGNGTMEYSATTLKWRSDVTETVLRLMERLEVWQTLSVPVVAAVEFRFKGDPSKPPDLDKLVRAIGDALTDAGVWTDDALVVGWHATKRATLPGETEGVTIQLEW